MPLFLLSAFALGAVVVQHGRGQAVVNLSVWEDLKRRNVYRVGVGYAALAWLAIEVSETIFPRIGFPDWSVTMVLVIALVGFPVALVLGWVFQVTPEGLVFDKPRNIRWSTYIVIDLVIVATLVVAGSIYWFRIHEAGTGVKHPSIAVLPFTTIGEDADTEAIAIGMADELLTLLAQLDELAVSSRIAAEYFADRRVPFGQIAASLNVRYIVEGSVQKEANRVRVTVQLIDAIENDHLWADNYDEPIAGLLSLRAKMAADIVEGLQLRLPLSSSEKLQNKPTENAEAFVYYLQAKEYLRSSRTPANLSSAEQLYLKALDLDPRFAAAHAGLCRTYLGSFIMENDSEWFERAEKACHRAMTLNDMQVDTFVALGELYSSSGQNDKALEFYDAALTLDPESAEAMMKKGLALSRIGRVADAETALLKTVEIEPLYWRAQNSLGMFLLGQARYDDAAEVFEAVTELTPNRYAAFNNLAAALYMSGNQDGAIDAFNKSIELEPNHAALINTANMHYYRGEFGKAATRYGQAAAMMPKDDRPIGGLAASVRFVAGRESEAAPLFADAAELVEELLEISPDDRLAWARLANYRAYMGESEDALVALDRANPFAGDDLEVLFFACLTYQALGRENDAVKALETLVTNGYTREILEKDPDLAALRTHSRILTALSAKQ